MKSVKLAAVRAPLTAFDGLPDYPATDVRMRYLICATQRTGSSLLADILSQTGKAGVPAEYFRTEALKYFQSRTPVRPVHANNYLRYLASQRTTPNGVFGVKILFGDLSTSFHNPKACGLFLDRFDKLVWMRRRDRVAQAVSYFRMLGSKVWNTADPEQAKVARETPLDFDAAEIARLLSSLLAMEQNWLKLLKGREYLTVFYEDLVSDNAGTVMKVVEFLGLDDVQREDIKPPTLIRLGDATSDDFVQRFLAEIHPRTGLSRAADGVRP